MESVVTSAVQKLGSPLLQEGIFLYGVKDQVKWVETELRMMQSFLRDANDKLRKGDERIKNWVREVTDVSYDAEDAIDTYMLQIEQVERRQQRQGLLGCIDWYASIPSLLMARHRLGKDIERIKVHIDQISRSTTTYKICNLGENIGRDDQEIDELRESRRRPPLHDVNDFIVGFEGHREGLVNQLLKPDPERRYVVSIVGMGGLGKSTLAKMVYDDSRITEKFPLRIWVTTSEDFRLRPFLEDITMKTIGTTEGGRLEERVHNFLRNKIYFIVIDDVWKTNVWQEIRTVLPDVGNGSRVLLTTRSESVAKFAEPIIKFLSLPLLEKKESWALFVQKAFPTEQGKDSVCPQELEKLGRQMVEKCGGLPLALSVLGSLLSSKEATTLSWQQVAETIDWDSTETEKQCMNVLALSYRNLPDHNRRSCFLYISLFPEDYEISASQLTRLWIAEGFIPQKGSKTLEDTARGYLDDFHQRSMIQVLWRKSDESISKFRIHDLLREMCLKESEEVKFFSGTNYNSTSSEDNFLRSRRLALDISSGEICIDGRLPSNLRSLFLRFKESITSISKMLHGLEVLRVLELQGKYEEPGFPEPIKSMTHLRYLKLSYIKELPAAIGNFRYLETLDLRGFPGMLMLPKELGELPNLRHLFIHVGVPYPPFPAIRTSTKLQTLKEISCDQLWAQESLPRLQNLRRLGIISCKGNDEALSDSISKLNHLASLDVNVHETPHFIITCLSDNPHLVKLCILGPWVPRSRLPESDNFPPNLRKLTLVLTCLEKDPMPVLEKLPNLMSLCLSEAYVGNKMVCRTDGFPRLLNLELRWLRRLEDWVVQAGAFPKLAHLSIHYCNGLGRLPPGWLHVSCSFNGRPSRQRS